MDIIPSKWEFIANRVLFEWNRDVKFTMNKLIDWQ